MAKGTLLKTLFPGNSQEKIAKKEAAKALKAEKKAAKKNNKE